MSKHYQWQRQPRWPTAVVLVAGVEVGLVLAIAAALAWRVLLR